MKNQNDLIFSIVFLVLGLGCAAACFFMKPEPASVPDPTPVNLTAPKVTPMAVSYANSLPGGKSNGQGGAGGFGGGMGMMGGPGGVPGGPGGGMGGPGGRMGGPPAGAMGKPGMTPGKMGAGK
ncbi:hypothetical protein BH11ARM1_BH11ARM1_06910 [soil metagenome]